MLRYCTLAFTLLIAIGGSSVGAEQPLDRSQLVVPGLESAPLDASVPQAVQEYLAEIETIEREAAEAKAQAKQRLLLKLGLAAVDTAQPDQQPGLIGTASINGEATNVAFHYHHGRIFLPELIRDRFPVDDDPRPSVEITLRGYLEVPRPMTLKIWHAAGGVSHDHGELQFGERVLGILGDDTAKATIYVVNVVPGTYPIRWTLTGGVFQHNYLRFENPRTGEELRVYHDAAIREETGVHRANEMVEADAPPEDWYKISDPTEWPWDAIGTIEPVEPLK